MGVGWRECLGKLAACGEGGVGVVNGKIVVRFTPGGVGDKLGPKRLAHHRARMTE